MTKNNQIPLQLLCGLALLSASGPFAIDMYIPAFPQITEELSTTSSMVQLTLTTVVFGLALGQLIGGAMSDVLGRKPILVAGAVISAAGTVVSALSPTIEILILSRVLQGLGFGACVAVARSIIPDLAAGAKAAKAYTLMMVIQSVAPVAAPVLGGILAEPVGWRGIFWVLTGIAVVQLVVALVFIPETRPKQLREDSSIRNTLAGYTYALKFPAFVFFGLGVAFGFGSLFSYISASAFVIQDQFGLSVHQYSVIFAINALGLMFGGMLNNRLLNKFPPFTILRAAVLTVVVSSALLLVSTAVAFNLWVVLPLLFLCVAPTSMILGNSTALATGIVRKRAGAGTALLGFTQFMLAGAIAPIVGLGDNAARSMAIAMVVCSLLAFGAVTAAQKSAS